MELIQNGPSDGPTYLFAHGAGADMNSEFIAHLAEQLSAKGIRVVRFNFPYMIKRAEDGTRRPPDRAPKLLLAYEEAIKQLNCPVVIGGKSMGGRMSSMLMAENALRETMDRLPILGSACLGYPFHAVGKDPKDRLDHLKDLVEPLLIVQGTRDKMGSLEEVNDYLADGRINSSVTIRWLKPETFLGFKS